MFAVIKTGGKQYRVVPNDKFTIERLPGAAGDLVTNEEGLCRHAVRAHPASSLFFNPVPR